MANAFRCDICGNYFEGYAPMRISRYDRKVEENEDDFVIKCLSDYDLCDFCADRIETVISIQKVQVKK